MPKKIRIFFEKWFKEKSTSSGGAERRRHPRIKTWNLLKVVRMDTALGPSITNLVNISEGGIQFTYPKKISPRTVCWLVVNIAERDLQIPVTGRVVWAKKSEKAKGAYRAGVEFTEIDSGDRHFLRKYIFENMGTAVLNGEQPLQAAG